LQDTTSIGQGHVNEEPRGNASRGVVVKVFVLDQLDGHNILNNVLGVRQFESHQVRHQNLESQILFVRMDQQMSRHGVKELTTLIVDRIEHVLCGNQVVRSQSTGSEVVIQLGRVILQRMRVGEDCNAVSTGVGKAIVVSIGNGFSLS